MAHTQPYRINPDSALEIRSAVPLGTAFEDHIRSSLASHTAAAGDSLQRSTVRFEDLNGPRGGVGIECRIVLVIRGAPSVVVHKRAASHEEAFAAAVKAVTPALDRIGRQHGARGHRRQSLLHP